MKIGLSSLSTELYSQLGAWDPTKYSVKRARNELDLKAVLRTIRWAADSRFESIDLSADREGDLVTLSEDENAGQIRRASKDNALPIDHMSVDCLIPYIFSRVAPGRVEKLWRRINALATSLEMRIVEMASPPVPPTEFGWPNGRKRAIMDVAMEPSFSWQKIWGRYVSVMREYVRLAQSYGLTLAIEGRPREIVSGTDSILRLIDIIRSNHFGVVLDISHLHVLKEVPTVSIRKLDKKIVSVHLSDNDGVTEYHWPPGQGQIEWSKILGALGCVGYDDVLAIDVSGIDVEREVIDGKNYIEKLLRTLEPRIA